MDEVTPVSVGAEAFLQEPAACFCLVFRVSLLVFLQLVKSMGEFALLLVGTVAILHKFLAEL